MECNKCKRTLPIGSKDKLCENCRGKRAQGIKDASKVVGGAVLALVLVIAKGKFNQKD